MNCELCGKKDAKYNVSIEGTMMRVCQDCTAFGEVKSKTNVKVVFKEEKKKISKEPEYRFVQNYGAILKKAREKLGLKQDELAKKLNERESTLHQLESEHFKPDIPLALKLERELRVKIVEEIKEQEPELDGRKNQPQKNMMQGLTLGDFIKTRKKK